MMTQPLLPPYPQPSYSVPYTASRMLGSSPTTHQNRNYIPPHQPLLMTPRGHYDHSPKHKQHHHRHQQPYPMKHGPAGIPNPLVVPVGGPGSVEGGYFMQQQQREYLFPPPTMQPAQQYEMPQSKHNSSFITQQMDDPTIHNPTPPTTATAASVKTTAAEDIENIDWKELSDDTTRKIRKSKYRPKSTTQASNNFSTSPPSAGESSLGKPVIKGVSTRRGGRGRARMSRDTSSGHGSKQKHQQR